MPSAILQARSSDNVLSVHLEESARMPNVRASDEPELQFHQPDEMLTRESVIADRRTSTPEDIASSDEMDMLVQSALAAAKPRDREVFILHTMEGFSVAEIAAITDRRPESINASILAAREHLRRSPPIGSRFSKQNSAQHRDRLISAADISATGRLSRLLPHNQESAMITREDIRELAEFQADGADCAISFYFQPAPPSNRAHREQAILVKDLVQQALREAEKERPEWQRPG